MFIWAENLCRPASSHCSKANRIPCGLRRMYTQQAPNSEKGFSARDGRGLRYQIKGRRLNRRNKARQLSAIRELDGFDTLAAVLFDEEYRVLRAALIPCAVVRERCKFVQHTNSHRFMLTDDVWDDGRGTDVTGELRAAESEDRDASFGISPASTPPQAIAYRKRYSNRSRLFPRHRQIASCTASIL